jgi:hypothetical protein
MTDECRRWAALSDGVTTGATLSATDQDFLKAHALSCDACRGEAFLWDKLKLTLTEPDVLFSRVDRQEAEVAESRGLVEPAAAPRSARSRFGRRSIAAGAVIALSAAAGALLWQKGKTENDETAARGASAGFAFVTGDVLVNQRTARAGEPLSAGDVVSVRSGAACLVLRPAVTLCAHDQTELVVSATDLERRRIKLESGGVIARLDPQPEGSSFGVETARGAFIAKGTTFAVELGKDGEPELRVHEGTVSAEIAGRGAQAVVAPGLASSSSDFRASPLGVEAARADAQWLSLSSAFSPDADCTLEVAASPLGRVAIDGIELGQAPLTALVAHGSHRLTLELSGFGPVAERLTLSPGEHVKRSYELSPLPSAEAPSQTPVIADPARPAEVTPARPAAPSADELLSRAREQRAQGRYADAASSYRRLIGLYPKSDQARASLVSLGELELSQLGNASAALAFFDGYLKTGGVLSQEARYGRIRALRKLGRIDEERAGIVAFLSDYPESVQAASLRARLAER